MPAHVDITFSRFGKLMALLAENRQGRYFWKCLCDCGRETVVYVGDLRSGHTTSCGCYGGRGGPKLRGKNMPSWETWRGMIDRCTNPNNTAWERYGGRGIKVCDRWQGEHGFEHFLADMGPRPAGMTLDRKNNDLGYSADNCRWATAKEQNNNRRHRRWWKKPAVD